MIYLVTVHHSDIQEEGEFEGQYDGSVGANW